MFANIRMFACSMFECSLIFFLNPCSRVRMFAEHERTFEHWTQIFIVRWPLLKMLDDIDIKTQWVITQILYNWTKKHKTKIWEGLWQDYSWLCMIIMAYTGDKTSVCYSVEFNEASYMKENWHFKITVKIIQMIQHFYLIWNF